MSPECIIISQLDVCTQTSHLSYSCIISKIEYFKQAPCLLSSRITADSLGIIIYSIYQVYTDMHQCSSIIYVYRLVAVSDNRNPEPDHSTNSHHWRQCGKNMIGGINFLIKIKKRYLMNITGVRAKRSC